MVSIKSTLLILIFTFLGVVLTLQGVGWFWPPEYFQKYYNSNNYLNDQVEFLESTRNHYKVNGLGAIGDIYKGQPYRIAVFGESPAQQKEIDLQKRWPELLRGFWGSDQFHVDNFAIGNLSPDNIYRQLKFLKNMGIKYKIIFLSFNYRGKNENYNITYEARWKAIWYYKKLLKLFSHNKEDLNWVKDVADSSIFSQKWRQHPEVQSLLVKAEDSPAPNTESNFRLRLEKIVRLAKSMSDCIIWSPSSRIAYKANMLDGYSNQYKLLKSIYPLSTPRQYHSIESLKRIWTQRADHSNQIAQEFGLPVLDWLEHLVSLMDEESGLFFDEFHVTEKGALRAAQYFDTQLMNLECAKRNNKESLEDSLDSK